MSGRNDRVKLPMFFALSLFAWAIWIPQAAHRLGHLSWAPGLASPLNALTVWAPGLAAIALSRRVSGKPGIGALFRSLTAWRLPVKWYAVALLLEPGTWALARAIDLLSGQTYDLEPALLAGTFRASAAFMIPVAVVFTLPNALGEELGWRAFALPRLQARYGALRASVVLGLYWGFWHVPAWVAWSESGLSAPSLVLMVLNTVPTAILFTWLFNRTGGSLLLVCLYHASITNTGYFLPRLPTATGTVIVWLIAVIIVLSRGLSPVFTGELGKGETPG